MLHRKDYKEIARLFQIEVSASKCYKDDKQVLKTLESLGNNLCFFFKNDNPLFDGEKFLLACGLK